MSKVIFASSLVEILSTELLLFATRAVTSSEGNDLPISGFTCSDTEKFVLCSSVTIPFSEEVTSLFVLEELSIECGNTTSLYPDVTVSVTVLFSVIVGTLFEVSSANTTEFPNTMYAPTKTVPATVTH